MHNFDDRKRAQEAKYAMDNDTAFRTRARRNRLVGVWAAGLLGYTDQQAEAYAKDIVGLAVETDTSLQARLESDLGSLSNPRLIAEQIDAAGEEVRAQMQAEGNV